MKVNVYGTAANAVKFILENRDVDVNAFIEGRNVQTEFLSELFGEKKPVIMLEDAEKALKQYFTVVASSPATYREIKSKLEEDFGLEEFEDFCYCGIFGKKIAVIYGNCHTTPIAEALQFSKEFLQEYGVYPLEPVHLIAKQNGKGLESGVFERCDLFIHQCIWEKNVYGVEYASSAIIKRLKPMCKVIGIPNVYRMPRFLFPQMKSYDNPTVWGKQSFFPFRDCYIDDNYKNLTVKELADMVRDDTLIPVVDILEEKEMFFEKLISREQEWDVRVSDFLRDNLRYKHLFYDPNHPTNELLAYIVQEILNILGIDGTRLNFDRCERLDTFELPIYGAVYKALQLEYRVDYMRLYNRHSLNHSQMDLEEYIRQYIAWNYPAM